MTVTEALAAVWPLNLEKEKTPQSARVLRYSRRGLLWEVSSLERLRKCGHARCDVSGVALRQREDTGAGYAGVCSCGSVWACPVCNAKIMSRRAIEIGAAIARHQSSGGNCAFLTFTMRHTRHQRLKQLWDGLATAWKRIVSGWSWLTEKTAYKIAGYLRAVEVTWSSKNGWHVHAHVILFFDTPIDAPQLEALHESMFTRWRAGLLKQRLGEPLYVAQEAHIVSGPADDHLAAYLTKAVDQGDSDAQRKLGLELTSTQSKVARDVYHSKTPWNFIDDIAAFGDITQWEEWEKASKGRRQLTWSRGLRDRLGLNPEASDEEIADEEIGSKDDDLLLITPEGWREMCAHPDWIGELLDVCDHGGLSESARWLIKHQVQFVLD